MWNVKPQNTRIIVFLALWESNLFIKNDMREKLSVIHIFKTSAKSFINLSIMGPVLWANVSYKYTYLPVVTSGDNGAI
jgi:hypothetical protein